MKSTDIDYNVLFLWYHLQFPKDIAFEINTWLFFDFNNHKLKMNRTFNLINKLYDEPYCYSNFDDNNDDDYFHPIVLIGQNLDNFLISMDSLRLDEEDGCAIFFKGDINRQGNLIWSDLNHSDLLTQYNLHTQHAFHKDCEHCHTIFYNDDYLWWLDEKYFDLMFPDYNATIS